MSGCQNSRAARKSTLVSSAFSSLALLTSPIIDLLCFPGKQQQTRHHPQYEDIFPADHLHPGLPPCRVLGQSCRGRGGQCFAACTVFIGIFLPHVVKFLKPNNLLGIKLFKY